MSSSAPKKSSSLADLVEQAGQTQTAQQRSASSVKAEKQQSSVSEQRFAQIEANTFKQILWNQSLSPEEKKTAITKELSYAVEAGKELNKSKLRELELFKEWLQLQRKNMSQKLISLTDTEAFSELKMVYDDINSALLDFDNKMQPLTNIVDAVFDLRMAGGDIIFDVFKEIKDDQEREKENQLKLEAQARTQQDLELKINKLKLERSRLKRDRSFFGLGGIKSESKERLAEIEEIDMKDAEVERADLEQELEATQALLNTPASTKFTELAQQKAQLRNLLDISSDEHKDKQEELVNAANNFVDTAEERVGSVMGHLEQRNSHIDGVSEMNDSMESIYTVLKEAEKEAESNNQELRTGLQSKVEAEDNAITRMTGEKNLRAVEEHITALDTVAVDTGTTLAELSNASFQIKSMKDSNQQQIGKTRGIQSSGIAGVAQRLATTLNALSGAALNEASEMTSISLSMMNEKTNRTIAKDALRRASGIRDQSDGLSKAIDDLAAMGQVIRKASELTKENVKAVKDKISGLEEVTKEIQQDVASAYGINADVGAEISKGSQTKKPEKAGPETKGDLGGLKL